MGLIFLLDSNTVIDFLGAKYPETGLNFISGIVDEIPNISVISKIEVLSFRTTEAEYQFLKRFCKSFNASFGFEKICRCE